MPVAVSSESVGNVTTCMLATDPRTGKIWGTDLAVAHPQSRQQTAAYAAVLRPMLMDFTKEGLRLRSYCYGVLALEIDDVTSVRTEVRGPDVPWATRRSQAGETPGTARYALSVGHSGAHLVIDGEENDPARFRRTSGFW